MVFKSEVASHIALTLVYFVFVSVLRWKLDFNLIWLWFGALFGTFFLDIDHLLYWFITHPEMEDGNEAKKIVGGFRDFGKIGDIKRKARELYFLLKRVHCTHTRLVFHSVVGQVVLLILAFYLLTSGGSVFGSGFILAINLHLLKDEWYDYFYADKKHLLDWLFWQVRGTITERQLTFYLATVSIVFLFLTRLIS